MTIDTTHAILDGSPTDFDTLLASIGQKDRTNITRHLSACETAAVPGHVELWKGMVSHLASLLGSWVPQTFRTVGQRCVQTIGQRAVQFFVADGKHRMQAFAMEDPGDGTLVLYARDILDEAVSAGVVRRPVGDDIAESLYTVPGERHVRLRIEQLTAAGTTGAPDAYRNMLGWNRRAIRITLPAQATPTHVQAVQALCRFAAPQSNTPPVATAVIA